MQTVCYPDRSENRYPKLIHPFVPERSPKRWSSEVSLKDAAALQIQINRACVKMLDSRFDSVYSLMSPYVTLFCHAIWQTIQYRNIL